MSATRRNRRKDLKHTLRELSWAIESFDSELSFSNYPGEMKDRGEDGFKQFTDLRKRKLPALMDQYRKAGKLTQDQVTNAIDMMNSIDRQDWLMAFLVVWNKRPKTLLKIKSQML